MTAGRSGRASTDAVPPVEDSEYPRVRRSGRYTIQTVVDPLPEPATPTVDLLAPETESVFEIYERTRAQVLGSRYTPKFDVVTGELIDPKRDRPPRGYWWAKHLPGALWRRWLRRTLAR